MQFSKITFATAMLLASAMAAPAAQTPNNNAEPIKRDSINDCGDSTFVNQSSEGSPLVSDCRQIAANIAGGGSWEVEAAFSQQHQLVQFGSCAFGVQGTGAALFHVGNQDIIDLINSSIDKFSFVSQNHGTTKVGAKGVAKCGGATVNWALYHN